MSARKARQRRGRTRPVSVPLESLWAGCPICKCERRQVIGPEDLPGWAFPMYGETVSAMGTPGWMYVCDLCQTVAFAGLW